MYKILFLLLFAIPCFASEGSIYLKISDSVFAGTEYAISNDSTYLKSSIETRLAGFSSGSLGFVPDMVIYDLELGHKLTDDIVFIYRHRCPHTIDGYEEYEYINYNEYSIRKYTVSR